MTRLNPAETIAQHEHQTFFNLIPKSNSDNLNDDKVQFRSRMMPRGLTVYRDAENQIEYEGSFRGDDKYEFGPFQNSFYVYRFVVRMVMPEIKVIKDLSSGEKIQIRFPSDLASNIISSAILDAGSTGSILLGDTHSINIYNHYFNLHNMTAEFQEYNGNLQLINTFSDHIPSFVLKVELPVFSTMEQPFPAAYIDKTHALRVIITMRSNIMDLIQIRITDGDRAIIIPSDDNNNYANYLDIVKANELARASRIHTPSLYVNHVYLTESEKEFHYTTLARIRDKGEENIGYNFKYFLPVDTEDKICVAGRSIEVPIKNNSLAQAVFWMLQNIDAIKHNDYSNYTDNSENICEGRSPIDKSTITYKKELAYGPYPADISQSVNGTISKPYFKGYNGLGMGIKFTDVVATLHGNIYSVLDTELTIKSRQNTDTDNKKPVIGLKEIIQRADQLPKYTPTYRPLTYLMIAGVLKIEMDERDNIHMKLTTPSL